MPRSRVVLPECTVLAISEGDTLTVKRNLTAGELRTHYGRMFRNLNGTGRVELDPLEAGLSLVLAYLVDWSLIDPAGALIEIRGQSTALVRGALESLDLDSFNEIRRAIETHDRAMAEEREAEKKTRSGVRASSAISSSPADVAGAMSGSGISIPMSTKS